ncbi:MAG TPA: glycosyltransferase [Edaphobacter sp.]|nr:glycosyltransferase [Edaphobacter sp.]
MRNLRGSLGMKIAHVVDSMEVGGAETLVSQMCHLQREQGHETSVYAIAALGAVGERMQSEGFDVRANLGRHLIDSTRTFFRIFRDSRPDVVHLHNPTPTIYAGPAARAAGVSSIVSTRHSLVAPPRHFVMERKYAIAARFCDWIVGICDATTNNIKDARSAPPNKIVRVYNGTSPVERLPQEQRLSKLGFTLLYVGRQEAVKNHEMLLQAFRGALPIIPDLQLWMVGDGSERSRLEELVAQLEIQEHVRFWGQRLDVTPFFASADVFIMSSVSEGLPMSLLQAFSAGLPAIVTDVGGMGEVVRLAEAGVTVPTRDAQAMTAAIVSLAGDPGARAEFSMKAEQAFRAHFTLQEMTAAYMKLYESTPRAQRLRKAR